MARSHAPLLGPGYPIELPDAFRSAAPFAILAGLSLALLLVPDVPPWAAAVAAVAFALAATTRAAQQHWALVQLRSNLDRLLLRTEATSLSPLLVWRAGELCAPEEREHVVAALRRVERSAASSNLPGAAPLNRAAIRENGEAIDALVARLTAPEPVSARGMILVRQLLDDPSGPLYERSRAPGLGVRLVELRRALDERVRS
jgi:hypothetical protein